VEKKGERNIHLNAYLYTMTTIRLTTLQKRKLEEAGKILSSKLGRRLTRGEVVERLAEVALEKRAWLDEVFGSDEPDYASDPLFDMSIVADMGRTDARSHDRILYGWR
jgi:hypothetical protein